MDKLDFLVTAIVVKRASELRLGKDAGDGPIAPFLREAIEETKSFIPDVLRLLSESSD